MDDGATGREHLLAGELAKRAGVSTDTLRHYERKGVLKRPRRGHNGYRLYPLESIDRVLLVRRALAVGFTLDELARILTERDKGGSPCREVQRLAAEKLKNLEEQLVALATLRDDLKNILSSWEKRMAKAGPGDQGRLLETLAMPPKGQLSPKGKNRFGRSLLNVETKKKEGK